MNWLPLPDGPHRGKTWPEVFLDDVGYVRRAMEAREFEDALLVQARVVLARAEHVRVPLDDDAEQDVVVFYHLLPNGHYGGHSVVRRSDPKLFDYDRHSAARTENCFDLTMPMRIAPNDPSAPMAMVQALKFLVLGDPHARLTRAQCERFFDDAENFTAEVDMNGGSPRLRVVTLRAGTKFCYLDDDGLSAPEVLERDAEVEVLRLALAPGEAGLYVMDGAHVLVAYEDEVRGERGS